MDSQHVLAADMLSVTGREGLGCGQVWSQRGCTEYSACALRDLCALSLHTGVLFQSPDLSPGHVGRLVSYEELQLLYSELSKHWGQVRWGTTGGTACARQWKSGLLLKKCFPKQEQPSGPEKSVMIYALSWL